MVVSWKFLIIIRVSMLNMCSIKRN